MIVIDAAGVSKHFIGGDGQRIDVLDNVSLQVERGEMVAVVGSSGSGKSTLLHILGALDRPSTGSIVIAGRDIGSLSEDELAQHRNAAIGFVFQFHHLLKEFSALENVMMPLRIAGKSPEFARERAVQLLGRVGLAARLEHRPHELSGGEQQRTAVARALSAEPAVLLADEPSGNLDHSHSEQLHDLMAEISGEFGIGTVVVTHNSSLAARARRVLMLRDGTLRQASVEEMAGA
jgi:lipoprotein-releasing system ATP-binding protein